TVTSGTAPLRFVDPNRLEVVVPDGKVAQLRLRVAVAKSYYESAPAVIDPRLGDFATGSQKAGEVEYLLFDGPSMRIEVMDVPEPTVDDRLAALAKTQLAIDSAAGSRAYALQCDPGEDPVWQWCGRAVVSSQRWRH